MPVRLSAARRRAQILEVAGVEFARTGYHALSMEALAEAAGISKPVLYQHFPSKRDLYLALLDGAEATLAARIDRALEGTGDNRERVAGAITTWVDFVEDPRFGLLFTTADTADEEVRARVAGAMDQVATRVAGLIATDAGLDPAAARFLATALCGLAAEGAQWWLGHPELARADAVALLSQLAWRGLGSFGADPDRIDGAAPDRAGAADTLA